MIRNTFNIPRLADKGLRPQIAVSLFVDLRINARNSIEITINFWATRGAPRLQLRKLVESRLELVDRAIELYERVGLFAAHVVQ